LSIKNIAILAVVLALAVGLGAYYLSGYDDSTSETETYDVDISMNIPGAGTLSSSGGHFTDGDSFTCSAYANAGYAFDGWFEGNTLRSVSQTYTFTVDGDISLEARYSLIIYDVDISINNTNAGTLSSSGGSFTYGNSFTCSAYANAGYTFDGWFEGSTLRSLSQTYTFTVNSNISLEARYSVTHNASFTVTPANALSPVSITMTSTYNVEISQRTWLVEDLLTGEKLVNTTAYTGYGDSVSLAVTKGRALSITQTVYYSDGQTATSKVTKLIDETVTKHYAWRYQEGGWSIFGIFNNKSVTWDVPLSFTWYYNALISPLPRSNGYSVIGSYVTYNDPMIRSMAQGLRNHNTEMNDLALANFILKFVQSIPYEYDDVGKGVSEYWKLPAETLWEGKGDCEDHAFLYASLLKALGYNVVLHYIYCYDGGGNLTAAHMAVGVSLANAPGGSPSYVTLNGVRYYYCEATAEVGTSWLNDANIGYKPSNYSIINTYFV